MKKVFSVILVAVGAFLLLYSVITFLALSSNLASLENDAYVMGNLSELAQAGNIRSALLFALPLDFAFCILLMVMPTIIVKVQVAAARAPVPAGPRYCPSCGTEVPATSQFCGKCGAKA